MRNTVWFQVVLGNISRSCICDHLLVYYFTLLQNPRLAIWTSRPVSF